MDLVDLEHVFGGERVVIYYISEDRIDFRELVKRLAHEFQTRIEMKQIGVRDEAKLLADYGDCGKASLLHYTHLVQMPPVSMKMAKATEGDTRSKQDFGAFAVDSNVVCDTNTILTKRWQRPCHRSERRCHATRAGSVINQELLAGQLLVQMEDGRRIMINQGGKSFPHCDEARGREVIRTKAPPSDPVSIHLVKTLAVRRKRRAQMTKQPHPLRC